MTSHRQHAECVDGCQAVACHALCPHKAQRHSTTHAPVVPHPARPTPHVAFETRCPTVVRTSTTLGFARSAFDDFDHRCATTGRVRGSLFSVDTGRSLAQGARLVVSSALLQCVAKTKCAWPPQHALGRDISSHLFMASSHRRRAFCSRAADDSCMTGARIAMLD